MDQPLGPGAAAAGGGGGGGGGGGAPPSPLSSVSSLYVFTIRAISEIRSLVSISAF